MKPTKLAVIPARGGSTRLKHKNIYHLKGKPLIRWMTETVVSTKEFDEIIISTDSDEIFDCVKDLPVVRHERPADHATTKATVLEAMLDLMETHEKRYDIFSYFLPTCPFTKREYIISGIEEFDNKQIDSVISMTEMPETIQLSCCMKNGWVLPIFDNLEAGLTNSKFIKKYYKPSGAFYMGRWNHILKNRNFFKGSVKGVIVPSEYSVDINTIQDIRYAESLI